MNEYRPTVNLLVTQYYNTVAVFRYIHLCSLILTIKKYLYQHYGHNAIKEIGTLKKTFNKTINQENHN